MTTTHAPPEPYDRRAHDHDVGDCPASCDDMLFVNSRLDDGDARMDRIESLIKTNTADTAEVLEILKMGKSFFKAVGYFGTAVKWVAGVVAPLVAVYFAFKNGGKS